MKQTLVLILALLLTLAVVSIAHAQEPTETPEPAEEPVVIGEDSPVVVVEGDNVVPDDWFDGFLQAAFVLSVAVAGSIEKVWKPIVAAFLGNVDIPPARQKIFNSLLVLSGAVVMTLYFVVIQDGNLLADTTNPYIENIGEVGQLLLTSAFVVTFAVFGAEVYAYIRKLAKAV